MAGATTAMGLRDDCDAANRHSSVGIGTLDISLHFFFEAGHFHRRKEASVRELGETLGLSRNADEIFNVVVPFFDVSVPDGPVDSMSVT